MRGRPGCLLHSAGGEANRILLASALSSMRIICLNRVSRCDWIIAVSFVCFVILRTSSFRTNWYHLMPNNIRRHHWLSASILCASVLDIAQQSEPYKNIGKTDWQWARKSILVKTKQCICMCVLQQVGLICWFSLLVSCITASNQEVNKCCLAQPASHCRVLPAGILSVVIWWLSDCPVSVCSESLMTLALPVSQVLQW